MKPILKVFYPLLAYVATYVAIWLHELGHALVYRTFGCKPDLFDLHVPWHFAAAGPDPLDVECVAGLSSCQSFQASMGGIMMNILLALAAYMLLRRFRMGLWAGWWFHVFVLAHLTEAASYLTLSNLRPLGDMIAVQEFCPALRLPLGALGVGLAGCIIYFIKQMPATWRKGLSIYCAVMAACMAGMRFIFAG